MSEEDLFEEYERNYIKEHTTSIKCYTEEVYNKLQQENKQLKDTLKEILHFCNHLHNDCKYRLNDGHIRKIRNICKKVLNEETEVKENEN